MDILYGAFIQSAPQGFFLFLFNHSHTHIHTMKTVSYHAGNWPDHQEQFWDQCPKTL